MSKKESNTLSTNSKSIPEKYKQKDWAKKLEMASGNPIEIMKKLNNVYLLIDCSGSMRDGNKIQQAKNGCIAFVKEAIKKGYAIGLIKFASSAEHVFEPKQELSILYENIDKLFPNGSTDLTNAIYIAKDKLINKAGKKFICIITDGQPDDKNSSIEAARNAHKDGINIITIGTDDADIDFLNIISTCNDLSIKVEREKLEQEIASMAKMLPWK